MRTTRNVVRNKILMKLCIILKCNSVMHFSILTSVGLRKLKTTYESETEFKMLKIISNHFHLALEVHIIM